MNFVYLFLDSKNQVALQKFVNEKYQYYIDKNVSVPQPYIILCGPLDSINESYVVVNTRIYTAKSPLAAVDLCFKIMFVFKINYPIACPHIWSFFHMYIYEIKGIKVTVAARQISNIAENLGKL